MRSTITAPSSAVSLPPCSRSWSVAARMSRRVLVAVVPLGDARVEVPAVVVEARVAGERLDLGARLVLQFAEAHDDVGHLDAGVVDVVLHFDGRAAVAEHAHEGVAERGVPQVADVRRLVRVDGRVLDDGLAGGVGVEPGSGTSSSQPGEREGAAVEKEVQVAVRAPPRCARRPPERPRRRRFPSRWRAGASGALARAGTRRSRRGRRARGWAALRRRTPAPRAGRRAAGRARRSGRARSAGRSGSWSGETAGRVGRSCYDDVS